MEEVKSDSELLAEIYRNAQLGLEAIADILPEVESDTMKEEILREHEEYERICSEAAELAHRKGIEVKEPGGIKKAMMKSAIKMNTVADNSAQHIAEMMIKGTVTGITSLKTSLTDGEKTMDPEIKDLLKDIIHTEESFEKKLKTYL